MIKKILKFLLPEVVDHSATIRVGDYGGGVVYTNKDVYYSEYGNTWRKKSNGKYDQAMNRYNIADEIKKVEES